MTPMNLLIKKEIRLILPGWITAMVLSWVPFFIQAFKQNGVIYHHAIDPINSVCCCAAALILGMTTFGMEINHGTFGMLLSHPISRTKVWRVKMSVLAVGFVLTWLGPLVLSCMNTRTDSMFYEFTLAIMLMGVTGGLWTTLAFRNVAAAFWITLIVPIVLLSIGTFLNPSESLVLSRHYTDIVICIFLVYSVFGFWLARRLFHQAQEIALAGSNVIFSINASWIVFPFRLFSKGPMLSLIQKEFGLHQMIILFGAFLLVFQIIGILLTRYFHLDIIPLWRFIIADSSCIWLFMPVFIGAMAVAEERRMNTLVGALCLPVQKWKQLGIKFLVAFFLSFILGVIIPFTMSGLTTHVASLYEFHLADGWRSFVSMTLMATAITLLFFFCSTLTLNFLQALGIGIFFLAIGLSLFLGTRAPASNWKELVFFAPSFWLLGLVILLFWLSLKNFSVERITRSAWIRNVSAIVSVIIGGTVLAGLIYWRTWEFVVSTEPRHGVAELSGPVTPQVISRWGIKMALLPDGRLWATHEMDTKACLDICGMSKNQKEPHSISFFPNNPVSGIFLGSSNWVKIAANYRSAVGIKSDGTLWLIKSNIVKETQANIKKTTIPITVQSALRILYIMHSVKRPVFTMNYDLQQIGTDSNWKTVASYGEFFLALKKNGTLWGWGHNINGVLGKAPEFVTNGPIQINSETNWINIYVDYLTCAAVKRDGTVWLWGELSFAPPQYVSDKPWKTQHSEPVCYPFKGTNWTQISLYPEGIMGIDGSGTMWGIGKLPSISSSSPFDNEFDNIPTQIGMPGEWRQASLTSRALKKDGTLWRQIYNNSKKTKKISRYSDWISIDLTDFYLSLASDGTLTSWDPMGAGNENLPTTILCNSRNPDWSFNILKTGGTQAAVK